MKRISQANNPIDQFPDPNFPRSARWLAARWVPTDQPLPHSLREDEPRAMGVKPLDMKHWIEYDESRFVYEIKLKKRILESKYLDKVYQVSSDSREPQAEVLEILLDHLPKRFPNKYRVADGVVEVRETGDRHVILDWEDHPLKLAAMLCQEDFMILRRHGVVPSPIAEVDRPADQYQFIAGSACYSFTGVGLQGERGNFKLDAAMHKMHEPVPGMTPAGFHRTLAQFFSKIKAGRPYWRSNWNLTAKGMISPFEQEFMADASDDVMGNDGNRASAPVAGDRRSTTAVPSIEIGDIPPEKLLLKAEYQTICRLPQTNCLLFTVHSYIDPLPSLAHAPAAACMLERSILGIEGQEDHLRYRDLHDPLVRQRICNYLRSLASAAI